MNAQKQHIVYVCREFSPYTGGGIGTYISNVCNAMAGRGHQVTLVTDFLDRCSLEDMPDYPFDIVVPDKLSKDEASAYMAAHQAYSYRVFYALEKLSRGQKIDVIEFPEFRGEGFATIRAKRTQNKFAETKLIVKCHTPSSLIEDINDEYFFQPRHEMDAYMEDYSVLYADGVTSPSQSLANYFSYRLGRNDIRICPYPLALPESQEARVFTAESLKKVAYIGSIQPRKGVDHFVEAALQVLEKDKHYQFSIYGGERNESVLWKSYSDLLREKIPDHLKENFDFAGSVEAHKIPELLAQTSVCLLPSRWENWANACLEAMNMGCVVCASQNGGMGEMIQHRKSGYLIDPNDVNQTVKTLLALPKSPSKAAKISKNAMQRAKFLTDPLATVQKIENNYLRVHFRRNWTPVKTLEDPPRVSVIIPYFNQKDTLLETIDSVKASDYPNIEIIVVNDGSTDSDAKALFDSLENVLKLDKPNGGLSSARNWGIKQASGDFFLPLDSDDTIDRSYISQAVECLINNPELSYVGCHASNFGAFDGQYTPLGFVRSLMAIQNTDIKCCGLFRKTLKSASYDENMYSYEDWDYLISLHEQGGSSEVIPEPLFNYRRHFDSMVFSTANHQKAHLMQYMMQKHADFWRDDYERICQILLRLWKDEEFERNFRNVEIIQIYYGVHGCFSEKHTSILTVYRGQSQNLRFRLPTAGPISCIRIDPCASPSFIRIREIQIMKIGELSPMKRYHDAATFAGVIVDGTAEGAWDKDSFFVHSTGEDPQIHLQGLEIDPSIPTEIWVELTIDAKG